jgi:predicted component of type VI protein secretion system
MKTQVGRFLAVVTLALVVLSACKSKEAAADHNKVDESFKDYKERNPDRD